MLESKVNRRQFIGKSSGSALVLLAGLPCMSNEIQNSKNNEFLFLEAEGFDDLGGWDVDQQSMDQMGSPYLLAHGLGVPVKNAKTKVEFPSSGHYRIWVRTRDWVAPWKAPGAPGKFQVLVNGKAVKETFGTKNEDWHWHDGGVVAVNKNAEIALQDLTGFEGRCEAILFCKDTKFQPSNDVEALTRFRRKLLNLPDKPAVGGQFDFIVVGGGLAGTCAAISAARNGLSVALVQDRPVLGGNASSEVRVWPEGKTNLKPYPNIGDIVNEILPPIRKKGVMNGTKAKNFDDELKFKIVSQEENIKLFINHRAIKVETENKNIKSIVIQSTISAKQIKLSASLFSDCTGDAQIAYLAGADYEFSPDNNMGSTNLWKTLDAAKKEDVLGCECKDKEALSAKSEKGLYAQPFPRCPWAIDLSDKPFPGRQKLKGERYAKKGLSQLGGWFWESGFNKNPIEDIERIRDLNFRAMYGAWDALKNVDKLYPNHRLAWAAFIAGKRESRRVMGDVVLSVDDIKKGREFDDAAVPCSWHIDLHFPHDNFKEGHSGDEFISDYTRGSAYKYGGSYWLPYRCLYSRNIDNLFLAGRNISVTKKALGPVRVMRTCGMMGEIVGKAASVCIQNKVKPRGVYEKHLLKLQEFMKA